MSTATGLTPEQRAKMTPMQADGYELSYAIERIAECSPEQTNACTKASDYTRKAVELEAQLERLKAYHMLTVTQMGEDAGWVSRDDFDSGRATGRRVWIATYERTMQAALRDPTQDAQHTGSAPGAGE